MRVGMGYDVHKLTENSGSQDPVGKGSSRTF